MAGRVSSAVLLICLAWVASGCSGEGDCPGGGDCALSMAPSSELQTWGSMREVMLRGRTAGRIGVLKASRPGTYGLGAMAGLMGEITIDNGVAHVSVVEQGAARTRLAKPGDQAALLVVGHVKRWRTHALPALPSLAALEAFVAETARASGLVPSAEPFLLRVEGTFRELSMHVVHGSCPRAHPEGPAPWRLDGGSGDGVLIGIYAEGREGVLTHHGRRVHLHALLHAPEGRLLAGHVDGLSMAAGGRLQLPLDPRR